MKVVVSGSRGLIGSALVSFLSQRGHAVERLVRTVAPSESRSIAWDPDKGRLDVADLEGADAVVHLAGESIAAGRWTAAKKQRIRDSRVKGTRLLAESVAKLQRPPRVFACASAVGYYGSRGDEVLREDSPSGRGFLAEVCREWEEAAAPAAQRGLRVVNLRLGMVLSAAGGALAKMLLPFRLGLGGVIGSGSQYMSWISIEDVIGAVDYALTSEGLKGPVNIVAPRAVTNREFTKTLGRALSRPTLFPLPAFMAKLIFGEMAEELLLAGTRVEPAKLVQSGYAFRYPELEGALRHLLGR